ncbi:PIN domain-containing protein [Natrialbaceae archaeon GCM10025810]|uniref:PIN domain-containing protein n=1 Tax=Halovalidus salilacus TaxID=3075124 RepID=UPI003621FA10
MYVLDSDCFIDYLAGSREYHRDAVSFIEEHRNDSLGAPTPVLYELARHEARTEYGPTVDELLGALEWAEPLPLTVDAIRDAAFIDAELLDRGDRIPQFDVLVAGIARSVTGTLVTRDDHYARIEGLDVRPYATDR